MNTLPMYPLPENQEVLSIKTYPPEVEKLREQLIKHLDLLRADYEREAAPIYAQLARLEDYANIKMVVVSK